MKTLRYLTLALLLALAACVDGDPIAPERCEVVGTLDFNKPAGQQYVFWIRGEPETTYPTLDAALKACAER